MYYGGYDLGYYGSASTGSNTALTIIACIMGVVVIVALWKLFTKAGEPGWKALIPFYNVYLWLKLVWSKKAGIWMAIIFPIAIVALMIIMAIATAGAVGGFTTGFLTGDATSILTAGIGMLIAVIPIIGIAVAMGIMSIVCMVKTGKAFGKSGGFLAGLVFLSPIFMCILAFGKAQYVGPNGIPAGAAGTQQYQQYNQ